MIMLHVRESARERAREGARHSRHTDSIRTEVQRVCGQRIAQLLARYHSILILPPWHGISAGTTTSKAHLQQAACRMLTPARRNKEQVMMMMLMTRIKNAAWACSMQA